MLILRVSVIRSKKALGAPEGQASQDIKLALRTRYFMLLARKPL